MVKHTQGEWSTRGLKIIDDKGIVIAEIKVQEGEWGKYEASASAQLFVNSLNSRSDMLEALKSAKTMIYNIIGMSEFSEGIKDGIRSNVTKHIVKAIAKAEGNQT